MTRLQELVEQATHSVLGVRQLDSIILAELIVKECVVKAEQEEDRFFEMGETDLAYAMQNFQNLLKQDFGLE